MWTLSEDQTQLTGRWGASGQESPVNPQAEQRLYFLGVSINSVWPALGSLSWHFDILDILVGPSKHLPLISIIDSSS